MVKTSRGKGGRIVDMAEIGLSRTRYHDKQMMSLGCCFALKSAVSRLWLRALNPAIGPAFICMLNQVHFICFFAV